MVLHFTILGTIAELEQLKQGLAVQNFDELMKKQPVIMRTAFQATSSLTCDDIEHLFSRKSADLAAKGSDKRSKQEAILRAFSTYIRGLKGMDVT